MACRFEHNAQLVVAQVGPSARRLEIDQPGLALAAVPKLNVRLYNRQHSRWLPLALVLTGLFGAVLLDFP